MAGLTASPNGAAEAESVGYSMPPKYLRERLNVRRKFSRDTGKLVSSYVHQILMQMVFSHRGTVAQDTQMCHPGEAMQQIWKQDLERLKGGFLKQT